MTDDTVTVTVIVAGFALLARLENDRSWLGIVAGDFANLRQRLLPLRRRFVQRHLFNTLHSRHLLAYSGSILDLGSPTILVLRML